ncbi:recQ-mediated genome instability protein 2 isoform X1 [Equus quagga]|uniref:recQ-mediated genome instability protein 2 isoform X1 n=1 Tax=Equus quagga TaxID=89248 RepID=UPI001EE1C84C|nr:recQ-mediated genome instability protein 2 isoform X1 [Equus quagga]
MAAAAADSFPGGGGPAAVKLPPSPPLKVLAEQLRRDAEGGPGAWRLSRAAAGRGPLELAAVWMQGAVVAAGGGEARLRDPSGAFSVRGLERVPRGRPCLAPGNADRTRGRACTRGPSCPSPSQRHPRGSDQHHLQPVQKHRFLGRPLPPGRNLRGRDPQHLYLQQAPSPQEST